MTQPQAVQTSEEEHSNIDIEKGSAQEALGVSTASDLRLDPERAEDSNIVSWEGDDDPQNPRNWTEKRKRMMVGIVSAISFITPLASSMFAPGILKLMQEFHSTNTELASFVISVYILGFAVGPLVVAPLSESYGRLWVFHICNVLFLIFIVGCAVSNSVGMLIAFRLLAGCAAPYTIGGGVIADLIPQEKRGVAMSLFSLGPLIGPIVGPIAGGFLAQEEGWRWVFWVIAIADGVVVIFSFILMRETNPVTLLNQKTKKLRKQTGNSDLRSRLDSGLSPWTILWMALIRPTKMLIFSPIILMLSLFVAVIYAYLYILFTTFAVVFEGQYGFSAGTVGLTYIGIGIGCVFGMALFGGISDRLMKKLANGGELKPEYRLLPMIWAGLFVPIGMFWYGWSADQEVHYIVPIIGTSFIGFGMVGTIMPTTTYIVDAFEQYAASGIAANSVLRSVFAAVIPLFGRKLYEALGLGWGNSLLGFIALALCPIPWVFYRYGERIRKKYSLSL